MKKLLYLLALLCLPHIITAQDSVRYRVIFIGDAGEMNPEQMAALQQAANHIIPGKTSVMYLGDNIYPNGMGLPGSKEEEKTKQILQSQYKPMRDKGAPVYFIPGNHDWDRMGPQGLAKIKRQWAYLESQGDSLLKLLPPDGCPDPVAIPLTDSLVIIAFDSEWWLFPYSKDNPEADCLCKSREDVISTMEELMEENRGKVILLAGHHPFQSYGVHGGYFTWKDHLFPFTAINHNLYIPLPVIGSLYPLFRSTMLNPEDLKHALYKEMIRRVDGVFGQYPNLVHVAGHEHGLQFIKSDQVQVVSGAGAKHTPNKKGKYSLFHTAVQGYVTADLLTDNSIRFDYYTYTDTGVRKEYSYTKPYTPLKPLAPATFKEIREDSVTVQIHPDYDKAGKLHRLLFGENFRKEWAAPTRLPVLRTSELAGGLRPDKRGGGMQSKSLRLKDKEGKEWVFRSVEKSPDGLLPENIRQTFARDVIDDFTSGQYPFGALVVPPIADAVGVPHANPVIGLVAPDSSLGIYEKVFANTVVLFEEREPLGKSDNSDKMKKNLQKDNDNQIREKEMLNARLLDMLLGDWDRHEDQWRWYNNGKGKDKKYIGVPRDRDQVFHVNQGFLPNLASREWILPTLRDFDPEIKKENWLLFKTRFVNAYPEFQFSKEQWLKQANRFKAAVTDSVLETALLRLPKAAYDIRHEEFSRLLKARRDRIPEAAERYYNFIQEIADIRLSDKNELIRISDADGGSMHVIVNKINKLGEISDELMNKVYPPSLTDEIRIYMGKGDDSLVLDNKTSKIKLRIIGGAGSKAYNVQASRKKANLYDKINNARYYGEGSGLRKHLSDDSMHTAFVPVNLYSIWMPLATGGINPDDGIWLGAGFRYVHQKGFRKLPYHSMHQLIVGHSFTTSAFRIRYRGEWTEAIGKADFTIQLNINAPDNTMNFFGRGNETPFIKEGNFARYYRTRFATYQLTPALRWQNSTGSSVSIGPSVQYYRFDEDDNKGRFINNTDQLHSYDSLTISREKLHGGFVVNFINDRRNNILMPQWGTYVSIRAQAFAGLNDYSKSYGQIIPEIALYKNLNPSATIVLADRFGGTITLGKTAFYQSAFIGGHENLLGYRQYRFAGQHSIYNNLELRIKLADFMNYILPGQFGIIGFHDIGRVWENGEKSARWHNGFGGGLYFAPASIAVFRFMMARSGEGWYPSFAMGMRF
jgi:hypothetical protein